MSSTLPSTSSTHQRNLRFIVASRVAMSGARAIVGVTLPIYLAGIGYSAIHIGELFAGVAIVSAGISTAVGFLSDRIGRRFFLIAIPAITAVAAAGYGLSSASIVIVVGALIGSFGRGGGAGGGNVGPYMPAEQALVAASAPTGQRTASFARLAFASAGGSLVGGLLTAVMVSGHITHHDAYDVFRLAFFVVSGCAALASALGFALVEPPREQAPRQGGPRFFPKKSAPLLYRLWVTNSLNGAALGMFAPFVTYWFYRRFGSTPAQIAVLYAVINLLSMFSNLSAAPLAKRFGIVRATALLRAVVALLVIPMVLAPNFYVAGFFYLLRMAGQRVVMPLRQSYVMGMADPDERSRVAALSTLPAQATSALTPTIAGALFAEVALAAPFLIASILQLANAITFYAFFHNSAPEEESVDATPPTALGDEDLNPDLVSDDEQVIPKT